MRGIRGLFTKPSIPVKRIRAARAVYESAEVQRIEVTISTEYTDDFVLELTPQLAHSLIQQTTIAYEAIFPPIRRNRYRE